MTEIARNDEECVCAREVRRENASEHLLFLLVDGSDQDWDDGYFFPNGGIGLIRNLCEHLEAERSEVRTLQISYGRRGGASRYCVRPRRCLTPSPRTSQSSSAPRWLQKTRKIRGDTEKKKHTRAIEGQATKGSGVFSALGQCTSIKIDMMRGTQDEDALARLQKVNQSSLFDGRRDVY